MVKKEILFDPFPKQIEFLSAVFSGLFSVIMYGGAIRGGKTAGGIGALLLLCKKYPGSRWAIVRDSLPTLKRTTIPSFFKFCPKAFIKSYNQDQQLVTFVNGSSIIFFPENYDDDKELNRWRGLEVNGFLLEEVNELNIKSFYKAIERSGSHVMSNKPKPLIMCTCNPANNWVKEKFYDAWRGGSLPEKWHYIPSKIFDNPFVTADNDYMESLKTLPRYEYDVFVNGNWDIQKRTGAEFYKEFNMDVHVKKLQYNPILPIWISMDENVNPYFPCTIWQFEGKIANCIHEIALKNPRNTTRDMAIEIDMLFRSIDHQSGELITGDATSLKEDVKQEKGMNLFKLVQNELVQLGWKPAIRMPNSNPNLITRQQFINTVFWNQTRKEPYKGLQIFINDTCKKTIEDFQNIKEDPKGNGKYKEQERDPDSGISSQKWGHMSDSSDYVLCLAWSEEYNDYRLGGPSPDPIIGTPRSSRRF